MSQNHQWPEEEVKSGLKAILTSESVDRDYFNIWTAGNESNVNSNKMPCSPLPWQITEATEKKGREIVDARGNTVAKLTALDLPNAEVMVAGVNAVYYQTVDVRHIRELSQLEIGREYWLVDKKDNRKPFISTCQERDGQAYFELFIWATEKNSQITQHYDVYGPIALRQPPDFELLKRAG
jgi:hypothetical protein